jgi:hypothetical protein
MAGDLGGLMLMTGECKVNGDGSPSYSGEKMPFGILLYWGDAGSICIVFSPCILSSI